MRWSSATRWFVVFSLVLSLSVHVARAADQTAVGNWPQWRGPARDGVSLEKGLLKEWLAEGPPVAWQVENVGVGYSSLAIDGGRIITLGDLDGVEHVIALDERDGSLLWAVQPAPVARELAARIAAEFKRIDQSADGKIDEAEALAALGPSFNEYDRTAPGDPDALASRRAEQLLAALDKNHDGRLDFAEAGSRLRDSFARIDAAEPGADAAKLAADRAQVLLQANDKNDDGQLDKREARGTALDNGYRRADIPVPGTTEGDNQLTLEEISNYLARSERGQDGLISPEELKAHYLRAAAGKDGQLTVEELRAFIGGYRNNQGDGPRGTPTIEGDRVYVEGAKGDVTCLDVKNGQTIWHVNLVRDFGGNVPGWGYSESPLIDGARLIVTPGGKGGTLAALDKATGQSVWRTAEVPQAAHYSSPVLATIAGQQQIVQFARESLFGVSADDGRLLWSYNKANNQTANCSTPIVDGDYVFAASAYGTGGGLAHVEKTADGLKAEEVYFEKSMANHHGGMVRVGDYLYGFGNGGLLCMNYLTGEIAWRARSVNKGSLIAADGMLYCLGERHEMALAEATPEEYREHGRYQIEDLGRPAWAHPVVAGGRLYIRNQQRLTAYNIAAPTP